MGTINPDDQLECIEADTIPDHPDCSITVGHVYVCEDVLPVDYFKSQGVVCTAHGENCHGDAIKLRYPATPTAWFWCSLCFKPVDRKRGFWELYAQRPIIPDPPHVRALTLEPEKASN